MPGAPSDVSESEESDYHGNPETEARESPTESNAPEQSATDAGHSDAETFHFEARPLDLANLEDSGNDSSEESDVYYSNDDSDLDEVDVEATFDETEELRNWALKGVPLTKITDLLLILRRRLLPDLPKTAQTFLKTTSAQYTIVTWAEGEFVYFGLEEGLRNCIDIRLHKEKIKLKINFDGLPLYKSSNEQFWPILVQPHHKLAVYKPFPIGIFCGRSKPPLDLYLKDFVEEFNRLHENGLSIDGKELKVEIMCFICDTPARAYIKNILGHGGIHACERCNVEGFRYKKRTIYPVGESCARTDESFRNKECPEHHNGDTPILNIPSVNIIVMFILDFMHLCTLGVMKKLLLYWLDDRRYKISLHARRTLSERMENFRNQVPLEFKRKPRGVSFVSRWKASEFYFFLCYCGAIVLQDILSATKYRHFLFLHMACRILCSDKYAIVRNAQAKYYLQMFADSAHVEYHLDILVLNIHNLIHMADDVINMNCSLKHLTAFPFESFLGELKLLLRSKYRALAQVCRRLYERHVVGNRVNKPSVKKPVFIEKEKNDEHGVRHVKKLHFHGTTLTVSRPNNCILLKNKTIFEIQDMVVHGNDIRLIGCNVVKKGSIFTFPCNSARFDMYELKDEVSNEFEIPINDVEEKLVRLTMRKNNHTMIYVIPFLH